MKKFANYKKNNIFMNLNDFYYRLFNTHLKRLVFKTSAAFCAGAALCFGTIKIVNSFQVEKGVGGLETAGVPEFNESVLEAINSSENQLAAVNLSENAIKEELSDDEELALLDEFASEATEDDNLDAVAAVFDKDSSSEKLELCYYTYRVKKGDIIGFIADSFNVTQDTIISVNNIHQSRLLQIGQYLKIPSMPGIIYTVRSSGETIDSIAAKYEVSAEKCARVNSLQRDSKLPAGATLFVPDAELDWVTRQEINGDLFRKPIHQRYWLSSYYGWRSSPFSGKRSYHSGVDMACPSGTPIYAALAGKVTSVGYNNVYGNYVIITHHSGYKTLYGHMSAALVSKNRYVDTGTKIGTVGSTGMSTGPHLHFTVYKNGKTVNPSILWR